jgi:hypothetical protein
MAKRPLDARVAPVDGRERSTSLIPSAFSRGQAIVSVISIGIRQPQHT